MLLREECRQDYEAVREVNRLAFEGEIEAQLVDRLRADQLFITSLVAVEKGETVGHILFTKLPILMANGVMYAASLAPLAVKPKYQRRGIGAALVKEGLKICRNRGYSIAVVLGHPQYYPRFGFSPDLAKQLHGPFSGEAWMALELEPNALQAVTGTVKYPEAFGITAQ